jgi:type I restriction enzyme, S subunit
MNAERLLQHYERIADAPDAIARLRRFILDLAIRGKLVPQDANDEPASELLKRIAKEKVRLQVGGRRREAPVTSKAQSHNELPVGWVEVLASELFPTRSGNSKLIKGKLHSEPAEGLYPGYSAAGQDVWLDAWEHEGTAIILSAVGARCGKAFLASGKWSAIANTHIVWVLPEITVPEFAMLHLNNESFWVRSGGAQPFVKVTETLGRLFPLPPLAEQHLIVAKVDELMGLCDRLEAARAGREATRDKLAAASLARLNAPDTKASPAKVGTGFASGDASENESTFQADARFALDALPALTTRPDQIKRLRQTILNLAVRGKLVPQDPNDEPASELLKRIAKEKARRVMEGTLREQKPLPPVEENEVEFELAPGWQWVRMAEVIKLWNGFAFKSGDFQSDGVPVVRIGDLQDGAVTLSGSVYVSEAVAKTVGAEVWIPPDALLIAMSGATTGKTAFNKTGKRLLLNQRVGRIEVFSLNVNFLRFFFETIIARNLSISFGTAIPNLSSQQINETAIPLPPLAEQHRIVSKVDELMVLCDRLEASLTATAATRRRLLDALLAEALEPAEATAA